MKKLIPLALILALTTNALADGIYLPNLKGYATGTDMGGGHRGIDISGTMTATFSEQATATNGTALPAQTKVASGYDGTSVRVLKTDSTGQLQIGVTSTVLPTGASTSALQTSGNTTLSAISAQLPASLGQKTMSNSMACTIASDQSAIPISGSVTATNPSVGTNAATAPTSATEMGIIDGTGKLQGVSSTNPLPITGSISASNPSVSTTGSAVPTSATMVGGSDGTLLRPLKVSATGVLSVDGSAVTQPVSGTITATQGTAAALASGWPVKVTDGTNTMPTADVAARAQFQKVTDGTNTAAVKAASTAAAATDPALVVAISPNNTLPVNQTQVGGSAITLGSKTSANSYPVVIASDQGSVPTKAPLNSTGSAVSNNTITTTPTSVTAASNSVEVLVQAGDANTANLRVAIGTTCSSSLGIQLQPGRSETFHTSQNISVCSESGTQGVNVQWLAQ